MPALLGLVLPGLLLTYAVHRLRRGRRDGDTVGALVGGVLTMLVPVVALLLLGYAVGPVLVGLGVGLLLLAAWPGVVMLVLLVLRWQPTREGAAAGSGAVIVLGAPVPDGEVGEELAARLRGGLAARASLTGSPDAAGAMGTAGARAAVGATGALAPLVLTGGRGREGRPAEAVAMQRWIRREDPSAPVLIEDRATTTEENVLLSTTLLRERGAEPPYAVVTGAYHAARTRLLVARHRLPLRVVGVPVPLDHPASAHLRELLIVLKQARWAHVVAGAVVVLAAVLAGLAGLAAR